MNDERPAPGTLLGHRASRIAQRSWFSSHRWPLNIGHRGAAADAPENTLAAFELALRHGADGVEFDVQLSADGVPVVIHDARLERTTSGSGRVADHSLRALRRLDAGSWFNRRYPARARARYVGRKIPLLAEVLSWVHDRNCLAFVEIKKNARARPGIEGKVLEEIHRAGVAPRATVISFDLPTLRRVRHIDPRVPLGIDFTRPLLAVTRARSIKAGVVLPYWAFAFRRFLKGAHEAGLKVVVWDLDEPQWMRRKLADGVDGIITGCPAKLAEIVRT
jgi:glycerophosphoryl diester phosphodiesterase